MTGQLTIGMGLKTAILPPMNNLFDSKIWTPRASELSREFQSASPYPHVVLDNFLDPEKLESALKSFPDPNLNSWIHYTHLNERKQGQNKRDLIPQELLAVIDELSGDHFVQFLKTVSGIPNLLIDPTLEGGGLHQTKRGGFLNIHADFTSHPRKKNWARRINVLLYLNKGWKDEYGGHFELWDEQVSNCVKKVRPIFNRLVIFRTNATSFHGHPQPLMCPPEMTRKSIALYYFTEETDVILVRATQYKALSTDSFFKKIGIELDKLGLRFFFYLKRRLGLSDQWAGSILNWLNNLFNPGNK